MCVSRLLIQPRVRNLVSQLEEKSRAEQRAVAPVPPVTRPFSWNPNAASSASASASATASASCRAVSACSRPPSESGGNSNANARAACSITHGAATGTTTAVNESTSSCTCNSSHASNANTNANTNAKANVNVNVDANAAEMDASALVLGARAQSLVQRVRPMSHQQPLISATTEAEKQPGNKNEPTRGPGPGGGGGATRKDERSPRSRVREREKENENAGPGRPSNRVVAESGSLERHPSTSSSSSHSVYLRSISLHTKQLRDLPHDFHSLDSDLLEVLLLSFLLLLVYCPASILFLLRMLADCPLYSEARFYPISLYFVRLILYEYVSYYSILLILFSAMEIFISCSKFLRTC